MMNVMAVEVASVLIDCILGDARSTHPAEACGLLFGSPGRITAVWRTRNVAPDPRRAFEIEPAVVLAAQRRGREDGAPLVGWYHSHPAGPLAPSPRDAAQAVEDGRIWLIAADGAVAAFVSGPAGPIEGRFSRLELRIAP